MTFAIGLVFVIFILLALQDTGYLYWGHHRGEYVERPEWRERKVTAGGWEYLPNSIWNGTIVLGGLFPQSGTATLTLTPPGGVSTIPVLCGPDESDVRRIVNDELRATPVYTGLKYGRFGDLDIDLADYTDLRVPVSTWLPGDSE